MENLGTHRVPWVGSAPKPPVPGAPHRPCQAPSATLLSAHHGISSGLWGSCSQICRDLTNPRLGAWGGSLCLAPADLA